MLITALYFASTFEAEVNTRVEKVPSTESELNLRKNMEIKSIEFDGNISNYAYFGDNQKQPVIFVHGTPGSFGAFFDVMSSRRLQENFDMVSVDRLGWSTSTLPENRSETGFKKQAEYIKAVSEKQFPNKKPILVGHSLGGSIVPRALMDYPNNFSGMVIVAGTIDPELGNPRWYNYLAGTILARKIISTELIKSNDEIMDLEKNLIEMDSSWNEILSPVSVIQGQKDYLVSPKNANYADKSLGHLGELLNVIRIEDGTHFLIWEGIEYIENELIRIKGLL